MLESYQRARDQEREQERQEKDKGQEVIQKFDQEWRVALERQQKDMQIVIQEKVDEVLRKR